MSITIGDASEILRNCRKFYTVDGESIAILDVDGEPYSIRNSRPHLGGPVGEGRVCRRPSETETFVSSFRDFTLGAGAVRKPAPTPDDNAPLTINCPLHGWEFDLADGTPGFPAKRRVKTYPVWVEDDLIELDPGSDEPLPAGGAGEGGRPATP